jgi:very-short-patch-repair endonuclease
MFAVRLVFSLQEAEQAGMSRASIRHALRLGKLVRLRAGVYCDASFWHRSDEVPAARHALEVRAALIALRRPGWASHYSAAKLLELPVPYGQPEVITISQQDRSAGRRAYPNLRLRTSWINEQDTTTRWGVPVLGAGRTCLDIAREFGFAAGLVLADAALAHGAADRPDFERIAAGMRHWSGVGNVDLVAHHASGRRESPIESRSFAAFVDFGLPLPQCNQWIIGDERSRGGVRSDFVWKPHRVVGEADGRVKYVDPRRSPEVILIEEKTRQARIEELGFVVVRWSGAEIEHRPEVVIDRIVRGSRVASAMYRVPPLLAAKAVA